ncbi:hypothetical protein D9M68_574450 [compost metagenome]
MTLPNFTPQSADVALDPMAGTLADSFARAAASCLYCSGSGEHPSKPGTECPICLAEDGAQSGMVKPEIRSNTGSLVAPTPGLNVNILALDLGTKTGYALRRRDGRIAHGTQDFTPRKSWSEGQKWARYRAWLTETLREGQIHQVVYELVIRHEVKGRPLWDAAHAYGAFQAITHMVCDGFNVTAMGVNLATVKKSFTGSGRAKKADMIAEANARGFKPDTDNDADALAILHWAVEQERKA